jgi:hypothetical protein
LGNRLVATIFINAKVTGSLRVHIAYELGEVLASVENLRVNAVAVKRTAIGVNVHTGHSVGELRGAGLVTLEADVFLNFSERDKDAGLNGIGRLFGGGNRVGKADGKEGRPNGRGGSGSSSGNRSLSRSKGGGPIKVAIVGKSGWGARNSP